jgi:hypothetical protein
VKSELLSSISSIVVKSPRCVIQVRSRGVPERYGAGVDTRGRQEGRLYLCSQQVIHGISGLGDEPILAQL